LLPLFWLNDNPPKRGHSRQVFLLTDGEIANVDEVLNLCGSMSESTRIFSFGLGLSPSRSLVKGLARATNGCSVFIPPYTYVDSYVGEQLQKALQPCITDVQIKWNSKATITNVVPTKSPPVYVNDRIIVYAFLGEQSTSL
jgi:von Willebrand factor A domain-containing protein 5